VQVLQTPDKGYNRVKLDARYREELNQEPW
jgi:hypothetical protein